MSSSTFDLQAAQQFGVSPIYMDVSEDIEKLIESLFAGATDLISTPDSQELFFSTVNFTFNKDLFDFGWTPEEEQQLSQLRSLTSSLSQQKSEYGNRVAELGFVTKRVGPFGIDENSIAATLGGSSKAAEIAAAIANFNYYSQELARVQAQIDVLFAKRTESFFALERARTEAYRDAFVAALAKLKNENLEKILTDAGLRRMSKRVQIELEDAAKAFVKDKPEILFIADYIVDDEFRGLLVCFKKYRSATHYDVYKNNTFQAGSPYERILFLDAQTLKAETENFIPYVQYSLGFIDVDVDNIYIILDTSVKQDRIYEYQIGATWVPSYVSEVDFDLILESKGFLQEDFVSTGTSLTLGDFAQQRLGNRSFGWIYAAVNEGISYFGIKNERDPLSSIVYQPQQYQQQPNTVLIYAPNDVNNFMKIYQEAANTFGINSTFQHLLAVLGGLPADSFPVFAAQSVDPKRNLFMSDKFIELLYNSDNSPPALKLTFDIFQSGDTDAIDALSNIVNNVVGIFAKSLLTTFSADITSFPWLTYVITYIRNVFILATTAFANAEQIASIKAAIDFNKDPDNIVEQAYKDIQSGDLDVSFIEEELED